MRAILLGCLGWAACQPGVAVVSDKVGGTGLASADTDTDTDTDADADTDADSDSDSDTDSDTDSDSDSDTDTDTGVAILPCGDGLCGFTLVLDESLQSGPTQGAVGAAIDAAGVVHVLVHDAVETRLLYLRSDSQDVDVIEDAPAAAERTEISLAVDDDGRVHAATLGRAGYFLLAREPSGTWNEQAGPPPTDVITTAAASRAGVTWLGAGTDAYVWNGSGYTQQPSVGEPVEAFALDLTGVLHALVGTGGPEPIYTRFENNNWVAKTPIYNGVFERTRLGIDSSNVGHAVIGIENGVGRDLLYADTTSSAWQVTELAVGGDDHASSLALDALDRPHVSYHDGQGVVFHGWFDGTAWHRSEVGPAGDVQETIVLVDPTDDSPVVVFFDTDSDTLKVYRGG